MKKTRYRIYFKDNTLTILSGDDFGAVLEVAEQIAIERKTVVKTITKF